MGNRVSDQRRFARIAALSSMGPVGEMICKILSAQEMTPDELIYTLMSDTYRLDPTEENLAEITKIISDHEKLLKIRFYREMRCFNIRTLLSL